MRLTFDTEQVPEIRRWYADMTKADVLAEILKHPVLKEAVQIIKTMHRPLDVNPYSFTATSEAQRSHELARKEGMYYSLEWLDLLASHPLEPIQKDNLTPYVPNELKKAKEDLKPRTEKDLEPLNVPQPTKP